MFCRREVVSLSQDENVESSDFQSSKDFYFPATDIVGRVGGNEN